MGRGRWWWRSVTGMATATEKAEKGAALLDERLPGWRKMVAPESLQLRWCSTCVLGQLFGDYERGVNALGLSDAEAREYGFYVTDGRKSSLWGHLTEAWRQVLTA